MRRGCQIRTHSETDEKNVRTAQTERDTHTYTEEHDSLHDFDVVTRQQVRQRIQRRVLSHEPSPPARRQYRTARSTCLAACLRQYQIARSTCVAAYPASVPEHTLHQCQTARSGIPNISTSRSIIPCISTRQLVAAYTTPVPDSA
eukprot:1276083-Rhodomonas_salina.1